VVPRLDSGRDSLLRDGVQSGDRRNRRWNRAAGAGKLGYDPAIASSIFVTTFTDVGGFFSFLGLASLATRYFANP
jgi:hypothetical protein